MLPVLHPRLPLPFPTCTPFMCMHKHGLVEAQRPRVTVIFWIFGVLWVVQNVKRQERETSGAWKDKASALQRAPESCLCPSQQCAEELHPFGLVWM